MDTCDCLACIQRVLELPETVCFETLLEAKSSEALSRVTVGLMSWPCRVGVCTAGTEVPGSAPEGPEAPAAEGPARAAERRRGTAFVQVVCGRRFLKDAQCETRGKQLTVFVTDDKIPALNGN